MSFISRQPNGLLCRHSSIVDCITHHNFTDEEYINGITNTGRCRQSRKEVLEGHMQPFEEVIKSFIPNNMSFDEFRELLKEMGCGEEYFEMLDEEEEQHLKDMEDDN